MTFAEAGESRAWSCFWVVTAGSSRTRGRWFCMEAPSSDSAYCFGFFLLYIQIFVTELFKRDRLGTVRWGGRRTVPLTAFHVWSSPLPQHRACPGFQRPPAEDNEEAGRRAETQGRRELPELPCWVSPAAVVSLPFFFFFVAFFPALLCPQHAGQPPGHALGWTVNWDGSKSQAAHVVSVTRATLAPGSILLGNVSNFTCALCLLTLGRAIARESAQP